MRYPKNPEVTVAQLIEFLKTQPQDAIVEVGHEEIHSYYTEMTMGNVNIEFADLLDFSGYVDRDCAQYGRKYLRLTSD